MKWLVRKSRKKTAIHLWTGEDTLCRMASTGGLDLERYVIVSDDCGRNSCHMCLVVFSGLSKTRQEALLSQTDCARP